MKVLLAVDQGTTNTKAVAVDTGGRVIARHSEPVAVTYPRPGWVESDPLGIWNTVVTAIDAVLGAIHHTGGSVEAVGISNQRETVVAWDPVTGEVLGPAVSWQCTRGVDVCRSITSPEAERLVQDTAGLPLDPMFSASKMRWLLDNVAGGADRAADGRLALGTVDSWLAWNLSGGAESEHSVLVTDFTNASRTALADLRSGQWSDALCGLFGIPESVLPTIRPSSDPFGECRFPDLDGVPIGALIGDSHAALVGHGAFEPGAVKASFGTGTSVMAPVGSLDIEPQGLALTVGWSAGGDPPRVVHALEGNIYATGAAIQWTADLLGIEVATLDRLAAGCSGTGGVVIVPAFSGLGAPHWDTTARGTILGLTRGSGRAELALATFEAVGHQVADVLDSIAAVSVLPTTLFTDGGAMRSDRLAATVADITGVPLRRSTEVDVAAIGAAMLAGLAVGMWSSIDELAGLDRPATDVSPTLPAAGRIERRERWSQAIPRSAGWGCS